MATCPRCGFEGVSYIHMLPSRKALEIARQNSSSGRSSRLRRRL